MPSEFVYSTACVLHVLFRFIHVLFFFYRMLRNLLDWLQSNSDPTAVLQTGSSLSAVLR